jgi:hypothetical protein
MSLSHLCAAVAVTLSAASFPAAGLMFGGPPTRDIRAAPDPAPVAAAPLALSPEGRPVRIISLSARDTFAQVAAASAQPDLSRPVARPVAWEWAPQPEPKLTPVPKGQTTTLVIRRSTDHALVLVNVDARKARVSEGRAHGEPP